jgi:c-di-GMP-related signal transduction protein
MNIYIARQPIFDRGQNLIGYELVYRSGMINACSAADGSEATLARGKEMGVNRPHHTDRNG